MGRRMKTTEAKVRAGATLVRCSSESGQLVVVELICLATMLISVSLLAVTAWCLAANLGFLMAFPITAGPFSNWLVWISIAAFSLAARRTAEKHREILETKGATFGLFSLQWMREREAFLRELCSGIFNNRAIHRGSVS